MWIVTTVWSDGPVPGFNSMIGLGAVAYGTGQDATFMGMSAPISDHFDPALLDKYKTTRTEHQSRAPAARVIAPFVTWVESLLKKGEDAILVSADAAHDWAYISYYCAMHGLTNPFKDARDIGDIFSGVVRNVNAVNHWKILRPKSNLDTPLDWAKANAQGLTTLAQRAGLVLPGFDPKRRVKSLLTDDPNNPIPENLEVGPNDRAANAVDVPTPVAEKPKKKYKRYVPKRKPGRPKKVKLGRPPKPPKRGRPTKEEVASRERARVRAEKKAEREAAAAKAAAELQNGSSVNNDVIYVSGDTN